ncbi:KR domain [Rhizoctonia solani]|uniref:KR domain n=1 Tax=Rhizoctonia solani TaxID=456999 RepID=A0A8H7I702_9AGAM|nr:KR domain [Rhizoctonia solani]
MSVKRRASKLAVITLLQIGSVFALPTTTDSVRFDCIFSATSGGHVLKYDLCPLLSRAKYRISRDVETPPSITRIHYDISLGDYIPWDGTLPARDQCEQGTNVCMTVISERPDHRLEPPRTIYVVPVAGNFPDRQLNVTSKLSRKIDSMGNLPLTVTFRGGLYMGVPQKAVFTFMCDSSVTEADILQDREMVRLSQLYLYQYMTHYLVLKMEGAWLVLEQSFIFPIRLINPTIPHFPLPIIFRMSLPGGIDFGLNRVHVLVTGAAGGIGLEIVQEFLKHSAYVTAQYHTSPGSLPELQKGIDNLELFQADVTDEHAVKKLFSRGGEFFEQEVQLVLVNHGIFPEEDVNLVDMDLAQWKRTLDVNLTGPFLLVREFLRRLRKPRRKFAPDLSKVAVVVIGSTSGEFGEAGHVDYSCSKAALQSGFIRTVKNEIVQIAPAGRINAVSPGWVRTPMAEATMSDPSLVERAIATVPLRKIATTSDIARQVLVLASSTFSGHVTGQNIIVAGGMEGRLLNPPGETSAKHDGSATAAASTSPRAKPR